ncbi:MAG: hypothetical protein HY897_15500 [Deltaproteobacteria bacterium]|nr:hypothetical protein [Deltaproteobacteria bacterium]
MNRNAMLFVLVLAALAAAPYIASCHCGPPAGDGRGAGESRGATQTPQAASAPAAAPVPLAQSRHALTSAVTTDADFLAANRGYGIETRVFGLANANPTVYGRRAARHGMTRTTLESKMSQG